MALFLYLCQQCSWHCIFVIRAGGLFVLVLGGVGDGTGVGLFVVSVVVLSARSFVLVGGVGVGLFVIRLVGVRVRVRVRLLVHLCIRWCRPGSGGGVFVARVGVLLAPVLACSSRWRSG